MERKLSVFSRVICELLDESGYSIKRDDNYEFLRDDLRVSLESVAAGEKCSGLILYALVD